jgi:hypothetical protein
VVDLRTYAAVVDLADAVHRLLGERWHLDGGEVVLDLIRALRAGTSSPDPRSFSFISGIAGWISALSLYAPTNDADHRERGAMLPNEEELL